MVAYEAIKNLQEQKNEQTKCNSVKTDNEPCFEVNNHLIEKAMKMYKTHRNSGDFDAKFMKNLDVDSGKLSLFSDVVLSMKGSF